MCICIVPFDICNCSTNNRPLTIANISKPIMNSKKGKHVVSFFFWGGGGKTHARFLSCKRHLGQAGRPDTVERFLIETLFSKAGPVVGCRTIDVHVHTHSSAQKSNGNHESCMVLHGKQSQVTSAYPSRARVHAQLLPCSRSCRVFHHARTAR